jgi:ubiquinone/menaquinone biosynthesis C-methylase UbiE
MTGRLDSDTQALKQREQLNAQGASYNLEEWIIQQVKPYQGMRVLDLGCGTGKQIFALASLVSPNGFILGLDISDEAVDEVNARARSENLQQIKAIIGSLDECVEILQDCRFDLILSAYAIYYAKDMKRLLSELRSLLSPNGAVFICGPGQGTNQEMIHLINKIASNPSTRAKSVDDFIQEPDIKEIAMCYSKFATVRLFNQIRFDSIDRVLQWWKNHNSFIPEIYSAVAQALLSHFSQNDGFLLTKNVLGAHYYA